MAVEDSYLAVISCTKARMLRSEMRKVWDLPTEKQLLFSGPDWLLVLLNAYPDQMKTRILLVMWRSWFLRNDVFYAKGQATIAESVSF